MATTTITTTDTALLNADPGYGIPPGYGFEKAVVKFEDGSVWKVTGALSGRAYQMCDPPCEARQVFACVCIADPSGTYKEVREAVMKVKYQVRADDETIGFSKHRMAVNKENLEENPEGYKKAYSENMNALEKRLRLGTQPADQLNKATLQEWKALKHLATTNCGSTPHLLSYVWDGVKEGIDDKHAIIGGYAFFMLMTKVPGERLCWDDFMELELSKRDEIREAFKKALIEVWSHQIFPQDAAPRNILWHEEQKKCYIVDFEDYHIMDCEDPVALWDDEKDYKEWALKDYPEGKWPATYYLK